MRLTTGFLLMLDSQDVFDIVAWHLLDQNERSTSCDGKCLYRAADGKRCAIGWIMPDDVYMLSFESMGVHDLASALQDSLRGESDQSSELCSSTTQNPPHISALRIRGANRVRALRLPRCSIRENVDDHHCFSVLPMHMRRRVVVRVRDKPNTVKRPRSHD